MINVSDMPDIRLLYIARHAKFILIVHAYVLPSIPSLIFYSTHAHKGTSMVAPHVAGVMAKYLSDLPSSTTPFQLTDIIVKVCVMTAIYCTAKHCHYMG